MLLTEHLFNPQAMWENGLVQIEGVVFLLEVQLR